MITNAPVIINYEVMKMLINPKPDCFAYGFTECRILRGDCDCSECSSFRTWDDCYKSQMKCVKRIRKINPLYRYQFSIPNKILKEMRKKYESIN